MRAAVCSLLVVAPFLFGAGAAKAATVFTDRTAWESAVSAFSPGASITTDPFANAIPGSVSIEFDSGVESTAITPGATGFTNAVFGLGFWRARVGTPVSGSLGSEIEWVFPRPVFAFGADFDEINTVQRGPTIAGDFDATGDIVFNLRTEVGAGTGFFGVVGESTFSSVVFSNSPTSLAAFLRADDLAFATAPVPLPGTLPFAGLGLLAFGLAARRKRALRP